MENEVAPKRLDDFIGNKSVVESLRKWVSDVKNDSRFSRRICFLTGSVGTGKTVLVKLALQEQGFIIREFSSSKLRVKQERDLLYQTFSFRDILELINKKTNFRKAIIIDDFENMCLASQEVFRTLKDYIKRKKSIGIPVIFIGNKYYKGKRPLMGTSVYFRLLPRTLKDVKQVLNQVMDTFIEYNNNEKNIIKIKEDKTHQLTICKNSGGDVRKIIKYFEIISSENETENIIEMNKSTQKGPLYSLNRIIKNKMSISAVLNEISCDGSLPYGLHSSYINYIPWVVKKNNIYSQKEYCSTLCKDIAELFSVYGDLKDYEKKHQIWEFSAIANSIVCWGTRIYIQEKINKIQIAPFVKNKPSYNGKTFWWVDLEKGKRQGDEPVDSTISNKILRGHLNSHLLSNTSFKMINAGIGNKKSWSPKNIRGSIQILKLKKNINSHKKSKITDRLIKIVGFE
jgi:hypothetical protein